MCWQLGLTEIAHHWSFLTGPLLTSVPCHHPSPSNPNLGGMPVLFCEDRLYLFTTVFQTGHWQCLFELSHKVLPFLRSSPSLPFSHLTREQAAHPLQVMVSHFTRQHTEKPLEPMTSHVAMRHWSGQRVFGCIAWLSVPCVSQKGSVCALPLQCNIVGVGRVESGAQALLLASVPSRRFLKQEISFQFLKVF